jgi:hypothetical protein
MWCRCGRWAERCEPSERHKALARRKQPPWRRIMPVDVMGMFRRATRVGPYPTIETCFGVSEDLHLLAGMVEVKRDTKQLFGKPPSEALDEVQKGLHAGQNVTIESRDLGVVYLSRQERRARGLPAWFFVTPWVWLVVYLALRTVGREAGMRKGSVAVRFTIEALRAMGYRQVGEGSVEGILEEFAPMLRRLVAAEPEQSKQNQVSGSEAKGPPRNKRIKIA